jgi:two-component sensor histidine kinase
MFAVVTALISATARSRRDVGAYRDALLARVSAFAAAQLELAREAWSNRALRDLVEFELRPYAEPVGRMSLDGPDLRLNGGAAESLAMVIHELATNAAKYGALSRPEAALSVQWRTAPDPEGRLRLIFDWTESGGPPVAPPQRRGFGSTVIESSARALGGEARLDYPPEGLRCLIDVPAASVLASSV